MKETTYMDGKYKVTEYENGSSIRVLDEVGVSPVKQEETTDQKIARLEKQLAEQNLMQMEVLATIYEQILGGA
ncbi:hypothetical protein F8N00_11420 [Exiguobacterium sp. A1_3_1]|uniref:hypothetical protein n=1 Tax=Exiguobacterium sp. A1_3_1 TaxID=2651871 RepID=UPI003B87BEA8